MLKRIKRRVHYYFLKKELHFHKVKREAVNLVDAKEVGILFDATNTDSSKIVESFAFSLREQNKRTHMLGFYNIPKSAINFAFPYFNKKNLNWYLEPTGDEVEIFIDRKLDILINAYIDENLPLEYISALSQARFRIGNYVKDKTYAYDFMIDLKGKNDLKYLMEQYRMYLKMV